MRFWIVILLSVFAQIRPSHALVEVPTLRFGLSYNMLSIAAANQSNVPTIEAGTKLGSLLTLNPSFLWDIPQLRSRAGIHFQADLGSNFGFIPIVGLGLDYVFYPLGVSSSREVKDDGSVVIKTRMSPFIQIRYTRIKVSINQKTNTANPQSGTDYFAVDMFETSLGAGLDYPMGDSYTLFGGLNYRFGSYTSDETLLGRFSYSGLGVLVGIQTSFY